MSNEEKIKQWCRDHKVGKRLFMSCKEVKYNKEHCVVYKTDFEAGRFILRSVLNPAQTYFIDLS